MFSSCSGARQEEDEQGSRSSGLDFWGLAQSVSSSVKSSTEEFVQSVKQTDWEAELRVFSKEAAKGVRALGNLAELEHQDRVQQQKQEQQQQRRRQQQRQEEQRQLEQQWRQQRQEQEGTSQCATTARTLHRGSSQDHGEQGAPFHEPQEGDQMAVPLTSLPADVLGIICSKLPARDDQDYKNKQQQPLSGLAKSTRGHPRRCLFSTCKWFRHAPEIRALFTSLTLCRSSSLDLLRETQSEQASKAVESVVKFPGLYLRSLEATVPGLKFLWDNEESRGRMQRELESLKIPLEFMAKPFTKDLHASLPFIIKGLRNLKYLDMSTDVMQGSPILQVAAAAPALQLKVLKLRLSLDGTGKAGECLRAVGGLKSLEEVEISFTLTSRGQGVSLLPLSGLPNLRILSLSTNKRPIDEGCACVCELREVLSKCSLLTKLRVRDVEVPAGEDLYSPVLCKLELRGSLSSYGWLEQLNCPCLQCVELSKLHLPPVCKPEETPDEAWLDHQGSILAMPGPTQHAAAGLARLPAPCGVTWCPSPSSEGRAALAIYGSECINFWSSNNFSSELGDQTSCLAPLRGSAAADALRYIIFTGVYMDPRAVASLARVFPQVQSVTLLANFFPGMLKPGSVAAMVNGWVSLDVIEILGDEGGGWEARLEDVVSQAQAAVQSTQHRTLTVKQSSKAVYVLDPVAGRV